MKQDYELMRTAIRISATEKWKEPIDEFLKTKETKMTKLPKLIKCSREIRPVLCYN